MDRDFLLQHAAQVFYEMLGQTCHPEFFNNDEMEYQEVSPTYLLPASSY
jgi:hypothetical protein